MSKLFIATQAPLPQTIPAFWRLVWEHQCRTIVCLAQETENGKVSEADSEQAMGNRILHQKYNKPTSLGNRLPIRCSNNSAIPTSINL